MPSPLYLCVHLRDFAAQALARAHPELHSRALAVLSGDPPLERVFAINQQARRLGLEIGMSRVQTESFPVVALRRDFPQEHAAFAELMQCAGKFSPRTECIASPQEESCGATLLLDVSGSERLLGGPRQIATALRQSLCALEFEASVAVSRNACAALLAARGLTGTVAIASGREAETLAPLPLSVLEPEMRWRRPWPPGASAPWDSWPPCRPGRWRQGWDRTVFDCRRRHAQSTVICWSPPKILPMRRSAKASSWSILWSCWSRCCFC